MTQATWLSGWSFRGGEEEGGGDTMDESTVVENPPEEDVFKILVASDIHLGCNDESPGREDDSFRTFEEILSIGKEKEVDFVILGGDLFHENKPKPDTLQRAVQLLRKYCLGSRPVEFEYLGDPKIDFPNQDELEVNYMNPNINIAMPVFTIHGNHDDPIGPRRNSAVDHLVAAKLVNHFGQWDSLKEISVRAVPLMKGETKLALFGLGHVKDERLFRLFRDNKIKFVRPREDVDDWFSIFTLHQNRVKRAEAKYIPESFIPPFFDLVIWGHEHECRIEQERSIADTRTWIIQPGSPVATSLCQAETVAKHVGILSVYKKQFMMKAIPLQTVRPFKIHDIVLWEIDPPLKKTKDKDLSSVVETYVKAQVEMLISEARLEHSGHPNQPKEPIIRARVFYDNQEQVFNTARFAQKFNAKVANDDVVLFKPRQAKRNDKFDMDLEDLNDMFEHEDDPDLDSHVETLVEEFFAKARANGDQDNILEVLSEKGLSEAVKSCVEKDDKDAISIIIDSQVQRVLSHLIRKNEEEEVNEDNIEDVLEEFRQSKYANPDEEGAEAMELLKSRPSKKKKDAEDMEDEEVSRIEEGSDDEDDDSCQNSRSGRGGRGGRGSRGGRGGGRGSRGGGGRGRGKKNVVVSDDDEDEEDPPSPPPPKGGRGSRAGGGRTATAASTRANANTSRSKAQPPPSSKQKQSDLRSFMRPSPVKKTTNRPIFNVSSDSD